MIRFLILSLCLTANFSAADIVDEVQSKFTYKGTVIHPGIIELFTNWLSDGTAPQILSVDLSAAQNSNRFDAATFVSDSKGWVRTKRSDPKDDGTFSYRFIGRLPSGAMVVHVIEGEGGSGQFESVLLFSFTIEHGLADDGSQCIQHVLHILRSTSLGDRTRVLECMEFDHRSRI